MVAGINGSVSHLPYGRSVAGDGIVKQVVPSTTTGDDKAIIGRDAAIASAEAMNYLDRPSGVNVEQVGIKSSGRQQSQEEPTGLRFGQDGYIYVIGKPGETILDVQQRALEVWSIIRENQEMVDNATPFYMRPGQINIRGVIVLGPQENIIREGRLIGTHRPHREVTNFVHEGGSALIKAFDTTRQAMRKFGDLLGRGRDSVVSIGNDIKADPLERLGINYLDQKVGEIGEAAATALMFSGAGGMISAAQNGVLPEPSGRTISSMAVETYQIVKKEFTPLTPEQQAAKEAHNEAFRAKLREQNEFMREHGFR
jgi:hypothetical protein